MFRQFYFSLPLSNLPAELAEYAFRLWSNFIGLGVFFGLVGFISDLKRRPALHAGLLTMFFGYLAFYLAYQVGDEELMFAPTFLIFGIWVGIGVAYLTGALRRRAPLGWGAMGPALILFLAISAWGLNQRYVDVSQDWSARELGEAIYTTLDSQAVYVGLWKDIPILEYLQIVENQRPDVQLHNLHFIDRPRANQILLTAWDEGRPVYTPSPGAFDVEDIQFSYISPCECYFVHPSLPKNVR